ncbi:MAG TPA: ATP-binding protein [Clostridia bacterium]|nr:ATP-binding protein [Clostridia bacterium]
MDRLQEIERSIIKKYRPEIWRGVVDAVARYKLVLEGDKIAVCISGGKDSFLMAKCIQELHRHGPVKFDIEYLVMDPGYNAENRRRVEENTALLGLPVKIFETDIFEIVEKDDRSPCYHCARMRRGALYSRAQALGCNKIALGHHFDDVIETILMSMLYGGQVRTMMPKLHSTNYAGMEIIRPMYLVKEADIKAWCQYNDLKFIQCACRFTENCVLGDSGGGGKRQEMKELIRRLRKISPKIEQNIFASVENINLETVISYRDKNGIHSFLDGYDEFVQPEGGWGAE